MRADQNTGLDGRGHRVRLWVVLGGMNAVVLAGLGTSTCAVPHTSYEPCEVASDCRPDSGAICPNGYCRCPNEGDAFCFGACRPSTDCMLGGGGGSGGSGGSGQGGQCKVPADCPQPGDLHCGTATCEDGACGLKLKPFGKLASQIAGDCKDLWCDGAGNLTEILEASDTYNDGNQCTMDTCQAGQAKNQPYPNATTCPETSDGYCYEGACVDCVQNMTFCAPGFVCVADGACVKQHCENDQWDQGLGETAKNCGGPCVPCEPGYGCKIPGDCSYGVCVGGTCQLPTCSDGVRNDNETGVDCGGPTNCPLCPAGQGCKAAADCLSKVCWAGVCQAPKCDDGIQNGDETDWDCGGSCAPCP
jgi:hypothetical protein